MEYVNDINSVGTDVTIKMKIISEFAETINTTVLYPIIAVIIFKIFEAIDIGSRKTINTIAATTLGVYLIHDSVFGRLLIWNVILKVDTVQYPQKLFPLYAMSTILGVFIVCSCIDYLRLRFIEPIMMSKARKIQEIIEEKLMK